MQQKAVVIDHIISGRPVQAPSGNYIDVAWLSDSRIIVEYDPDVAGPRPQGSRLWQLNLAIHDLRPIELPIPVDPACGVAFFLGPTRLTDKQLAVTRLCSGSSWPQVQLLVWNSISSLVDLRYSYDMPIDAGAFSFAPDGSRSIFSSHTAIADSLRWADPVTYTQIDVGMDRAHYPTWSPDGTTIAFFGARDLAGSPSPDWTNKPDDLWIMPANCAQLAGGCRQSVALLLSDVFDPRRVKWAPQGTWLVFDGNLQGNGQGIWLLDTKAHSVYRIASGDYEDPDWSPDGQKIIVLAPTTKSPNDPNWRINPGLQILDVHDLVGP